MANRTTRIDVRDVTPAGAFSAWLARTRRVLASEADADVPCGACTACCTSGYFIHVRPDETRALARIPKALLFPAPGLPKGHRVMGHDENGRCPMLVDGACSIYEDRPQTCRDYDCRVFAATGIDPADKPLIATRVRSWRFAHPSSADERDHAAVEAAVAFFRDHADAFTTWAIPTNTTQLAVLAMKASGAFADDPDSAKHEPPGDVAAAVMAEVRRYDPPR